MIFVGKDFQNMTEEEIRSSIRGDKVRIGLCKRAIELKPFTDDEDHDVDIERTLLEIGFLRESINAAVAELEKRGLTYTPSRTDVDSARFQSKLTTLQKILLKNKESANEYEYEFDFTGDKMVAKDLRAIENEELYTLDKCQVLEAISELYIGEWKKDYTCDAYSIYFLISDAWSVTFIFEDGEQKTTGGSFEYPYNFFDFLYIIDPDEKLPMRDY